MCGICGELQFGRNTPSIQSVAKMTSMMEQRGPDAAGFHSQGHTALGQRRLKVIDLSERAHQPMVDSAVGLEHRVQWCRLQLCRHCGQELESKWDTRSFLMAIQRSS
jgi:asparagine synthase (glutamine-hydrolysing)